MSVPSIQQNKCNNLTYLIKKFPFSKALPKNYSETTFMKLYMHILGDGYISKTRFEGSTFTYTSKLMGELLLYFGKDFGIKNPKSIGAVFTQCGELCEEITKGSNKEEKESALDRIAQVLENALKNANVGQTFLIPGGSETHAVLAYVEKTGTNTCKLLLINTGQGTGLFHKMDYQGGSTFICPFAAFSRIPYQDLDGGWKQVMAALLRPDALLEKGEKSEYCTTHFYAEMLSFLVSYYDANDPSQKILLRPQRDGVCSWTSLLAALRLYLEEKNVLTTRAFY